MGGIVQRISGLVLFGHDHGHYFHSARESSFLYYVCVSFFWHTRSSPSWSSFSFMGHGPQAPCGAHFLMNSMHFVVEAPRYPRIKNDIGGAGLLELFCPR